MEGHQCNFDVKQRMKCPFWASGSFKRRDSEAACSTRHMEQVQRPRPTCESSCCTADPGPGAWIVDKQAPGHKVFQPDAGCVYYQYGRQEILESFQGASTDIMIVGDSFLRQLFVRLLHLMRGQERVVDYKIHTHASYATCDAADSFVVAPAYNDGLGANKDKQFYSVNSFFLGHNVTSDPRWSDCSQQPMQVHYMFGSTFRQQVRNLERYSKDGWEPTTKIDVVISVMFWTHEWETPAEWLDALAALKAQKFVRRLFLLGIPTARVDPTKPDYVKAYQNRNHMMREWVANQTSGAHYIDFDVLSTSDGIPGACTGGNKHYACHLRYTYKDGNTTDSHFRDPFMQVPLNALYSSEDGECFDDVNAAVWQMYFNVAMKEKKAKKKGKGSKQASKGSSSASKQQGSRGGSGSGGDSSRVSSTLPPTSSMFTLPLYIKHFLNRLWIRGAL